MKITFPAMFTGAILIAALAVAGCASSGGSKSGASTAAGMTRAGEGVEALAAQTEVTMSALNDLVLNPGDQAAQFKKYDAAVRRLSSDYQKAVDRTTAMREKAQAFFDQWRSSTTNIVNEDIRRINERRFEEVRRAFQNVDSSLQHVKEAYSPFLSDLNDIRQALSVDLTPGGVKAMAGIAEKAMPKGKNLKDALLQAANDVKALGAKLAPASPETGSQ